MEVLLTVSMTMATTHVGTNDVLWNAWSGRIELGLMLTIVHFYLSIKEYSLCTQSAFKIIIMLLKFTTQLH